MKFNYKRFEDQFWSKLNKQAPNGCWLWTGYVHKMGYGQTMLRGKPAMVHRKALVLSGIDLIPGLTVDHLCKQKLCCNPAHLEQVPLVVNIKRGTKATQTHCHRGHEFNKENTRFEKHRYKRTCRQCEKIWSAAKRLRKKVNLSMINL